MAEEQNTAKQEIVIIRRRGGEDLTAAKGGAWKIAYADFVTAMMAFFLVMWLINAANEATRAQVASYFNPIKLTDSSTGGKGLNDPKDVKKKKSQSGASGEAEASAAEKAAEEKILAEPSATLDRIAGHAGINETVKVPVADEVPKNVTDPFDPMAWQAVPQKPAEAPVAEAQEGPQQENNEKTAQKPNKIQKAENHVAEKDKTGSGKEMPNARGDSLNAANPDEAKKSTGQMGTAVQETAEDGDKKVNANRIKIAAEIKTEILEALNQQPEAIPATIEVEGSDEGLLVSLIDKSDDGMFNVGSAEPSPKLVELVATIAQVLGKHRGFIVVRGHTDSRPFRNKRYDNWQLSTARAHMAYYMLVRGGLDASRVRRIEGLADRDPRIPAQPDAPENRRIDILLGQDS